MRASFYETNKKERAFLTTIKGDSHRTFAWVMVRWLRNTNAGKLLIFKNDQAGDKNLFFIGKVILRPN